MLRSAVALSVLVLGLVLLSARPVRAPQDPEPVLAGGALLEHMEGLKKNLKGAAMAMQAQDGEKALQHVAEMQRLVLLAKLETPPNEEEKPEAERDAHRLAFRKDLIHLLQELAGMEVELLDEDWEKAFGRVTGPLFRMRTQAHDRYQLSK